MRKKFNPKHETARKKNWEIFLIQKIKTFPIKECCVYAPHASFEIFLLRDSLLFSPSVNFSLRYTVSNTRIIEMEKEEKSSVRSLKSTSLFRFVP